MTDHAASLPEPRTVEQIRATGAAWVTESELERLCDRIAELTALSTGAHGRRLMSVEYVGPFQQAHVVIDGREVPHLTATLLPRGRIELILDGRYSLELEVSEAERVVPFLADAIAVGMGYASHPRDGQEPVPLPPFRRMTELAEVPNV